MTDDHGWPEMALTNIHQTISAHARSRPEAPAVSCDGVSLTYRELDDRSDVLANALVTAGAGAGDVVGVLLAPSIDLITALLAILKSGCAYLALDPGDPTARHEEVLEICSSRLVVAARGFELPGQVTIVDPTELPASAERAALPEVGADELAYVSFTSGTTGRPKGVAVPHRGVLRLFENPNWVRVTPEDVLLQVAPIAFDASTVEIWGALLSGALLVVHAARPLDLAELAVSVAEHKVSVLLLATGLFQRMVAEQLEAFAGVRHVLTGGEAASPDAVRTLHGKYPHLLFTNGYGPTENTSFTTCWTSATAPEGSTVPIGVAVTGTGVLVLDDQLRPLPDGEWGELYATGAGLARGYLGDPLRTAERFVAAVGDCPPGARMYRTGDLARRTPDGTYEFGGRVDRQVKVRGYRVEPQHVEEALGRLPGVLRAAVSAHPNSSGANRLVAFVVPATSDTDGDFAPRLRAQLLEHLPHYQVPASIVLCESIPLNRNGKVDYLALQAPQRQPRMLGTPYTAPRDELEETLAELWGELLDIETVGIHDDFFALGGYSLLVAGMLSRLKAELGVELSARVLYVHPTIAELRTQLS